MKIFPSASGETTPAAYSCPPTLSSHALVYYRDLILVLLAKDFKVRYKSTFMGYAWSVIHPLAFASVFFLVFQVVARFRVPAYALYLIAGLFPWQCMANTTQGANFYFLGNGSLIKKVRFHRATLVLAGVLNELVHFIVSIPVIAGFMLYYHQAPAPGWLWILPLLVLIQLTMQLGIALLVATSNLFFRDLERLTGIAMHLVFYLTPIIFPVEQLPSEWRWILWANPLAGLVLCWQGLFYRGTVPGEFLAIAAVWSLVFLGAGAALYKKTVWRFAEIV